MPDIAPQEKPLNEYVDLVPLAIFFNPTLQYIPLFDALDPLSILSPVFRRANLPQAPLSLYGRPLRRPREYPLDPSRKTPLLPLSLLPPHLLCQKFHFQNLRPTRRRRRSVQGLRWLA